MVQKGTVSSIKSGKAVVTSVTGITTPELSIPKIFQYDQCCDCEYCTTCYICDKLKVGDMVVFAMFDDGTGAILQKMQG